MQQSHLIALVPLFPLLGAILLGLLSLFYSHNEAGPSKKLVSLIAVAGPIASCVVASQLFMALGQNKAGFVQTLWTWFAVGNLQVPVSLQADRLSGVMIMIVTFVG